MELSGRRGISHRTRKDGRAEGPAKDTGWEGRLQSHMGVGTEWPPLDGAAGLRVKGNTSSEGESHMCLLIAAASTDVRSGRGARRWERARQVSWL